MHSLAVSFELTFCVSTLKSKWLLKMLKKRSKVKFGNPSGLIKLKIRQDAKFIIKFFTTVISIISDYKLVYHSTIQINYFIVGGFTILFHYWGDSPNYSIFGGIH